MVCSIHLGALNMEQTKYLNWGDLGSLLGNTVRLNSPLPVKIPPRSFKMRIAGLRWLRVARGWCVC